jgi:hypothetical protein
MSENLPANQNCTSVARPPLSANGILIGARRKADSLSLHITDRQTSGIRFQPHDSRQRPLQGNDLYFSPARAVYLRPRAVKVDTYC